MTLRPTHVLAMATAISAIVAAVPVNAQSHDRNPIRAAHARSAPTVVGVASANEDFSTLVTAIQTADLVDTLNGSGPFTVFAPTDDAFAALPSGTVRGLLRPSQRAQLSRILTYHVVSGRFTAADLATAVRVGGGTADLKTVEGGRLTVADRGRGRLRLTDAAGAHIDIEATDVSASNGIIHVIDGVLTPH